MKNRNDRRMRFHDKIHQSVARVFLCTLLIGFLLATPMTRETAYALDLSILGNLSNLTDIAGLASGNEDDTLSGLLGLLGMGSTSLKDATISKIADQKYTGSAITPNPVVTLNGKRLKKNTDYTVKYSNNTKVGTARCTVTGKGDYTGSKSISFKIVRNASSSGSSAQTSKSKKFTVKLTKTSFVYNATARKPSVKVTAGGKSVTSSNYTVSYKDHKSVGTATVTVTGKGDYKGYKGTATFKITLKKVTLQSAKAVDSASVKVTWKTDSQADGYEIQYGTNSSFSGAQKAAVTSKSKSTLTLDSLKAARKYYIRIRSYKKVGKETWYSTWSAAKTATTKKS